MQAKGLRVQAATRLLGDFDHEVDVVDGRTRWNERGNIELEEGAIGRVVLGRAGNERCPSAGAVEGINAIKGGVG